MVICPYDRPQRCCSTPTHPSISLPSCPARSPETLGLFYHPTGFHTLLPTPGHCSLTYLSKISRAQEIRVGKPLPYWPLLGHMSQSRGRNPAAFAPIKNHSSPVPAMLALCAIQEKKCCCFCFPCNLFFSSASHDLPWVTLHFTSWIHLTNAFGKAGMLRSLTMCFIYHTTQTFNKNGQVPLLL